MKNDGCDLYFTSKFLFTHGVIGKITKNFESRFVEVIHIGKDYKSRSGSGIKRKTYGCKEITKEEFIKRKNSNDYYPCSNSNFHQPKPLENRRS